MSGMQVIANKTNNNSDNSSRSLDILARYKTIRAQSLAFCASLQTEDYGLQAMPETSPPKWHLAHTTWFFETFILKLYSEGYTPVNPHYEYMFNSYYNGIGDQYPRPQRGLLSRPTVEEVVSYRGIVDDAIERLVENAAHPDYDDILMRLELGLHHEQQHQELFFTDIKYSLSKNPLEPVYCADKLVSSETELDAMTFVAHDEGMMQMGHQSKGFCFDNELPVHQVFLPGFEIATRPVSCGEYIAFIEDGAYNNPALWLSDGWAEVKAQQWFAPLYWRQIDGEWFEYTLHGLQPVDRGRPVCHVSAYEADAYARWAGARLPSEAEWERVAQTRAVQGQFVETGQYHPAPIEAGKDMMFGSVWEWTSSAYGPYPGFTAAEGAIGEYNGKFMCNQLVLRGGSCVSSESHLRSSYRNFFYPADRWQFSGIRLAK